MVNYVLGKIENLNQIKCFLFDMDGTINLGNTLIAGMEGFFEKLKASGRTFYLVTNNSSKDHQHYVAKMQRLGIDVGKEDILISSDALVYYLKKKHSQAKLLVLGTPELVYTLQEGGLNVLEKGGERPDFIILGFDMTLNYESLATACRWIDKGVPYLATHPDVRCPIEGGEFLPDCGAMIELIKTATSKSPQLIFGKPYHYLVDMVMERTGYSKDAIAMVGDRLSTDIAFGLNNELLSILVLTGEATKEDVKQGTIKPDLMLTHAAEILKYL
ncbi:MAG TPA: HAD-IIA family hydrolase [Candidatus Avacidaminococcus intestinavium]|uniref:Acid sugar phosphatase n=1 Tax=Candidatus Avacidaminococcus intestinavium TaxID=2840684 RepID=A0A9D1MQ90_9FIRM|nr:HAD-IIA family hydrolase [Candidatus Avacidaminococcus intestinavium]